VQDDIEMITAIMPLPEHVHSLVICIVGAPVWIHTVQGAVDDLRSLNFVHTESLFFSPKPRSPYAGASSLRHQRHPLRDLRCLIYAEALERCA
jgi:hypothetical protein